VYARLKTAGLVYQKAVEQFYDPVKGMFLPDRYIKGECPNCHSKDQYGDACEVCSTVYAPTDLINPYSALTGARPVLKASEHFFFRLSDPQCVAFLKQWLDTPGRLQPQVANKAREWLTGGGELRLSDWDISRDAPYFGIPIPDAPGKYFYVWLDAPIGYLAALKSYFALGKARANGERRSFEEFLSGADTEDVALTMTARAVVAGALARCETRGCHHRSDFPDTDSAQARSTTARQASDGRVLVDAPVPAGACG